MEYFDIINEYGEFIDEVRSREEVHRLGLWHRAVHIWIYRKHQGTYHLLKQHLYVLSVLLRMQNVQVLCISYLILSVRFSL